MLDRRPLPRNGYPAARTKKRGNAPATDPKADNLRIELREATPADVDALAGLINGAYRVEDVFKIGDRIDASGVRDEMSRGRFLVLQEHGSLAGCVYVAVEGTLGYFGLLSVDPSYQGRGLGSTLLRAAEDHCRRAGCCAMEILVVDLRTELFPYYERHGYVRTGTRPFPEAERTSQPCEFVVMRKDLRAARDSDHQ